MVNSFGVLVHAQLCEQGEAAQRVDYAAALHRHYCGRAMPTIYDWTDHDLPDMIIAELPARKVLADGPRLTNTFVNGTVMPLFAHLQETPLKRQIEWLRSALVLIHEELARGFALWSAENPNSKLPRVSLVQNTELSETLINTKVDMMQDLVEQEGLADDSDTSLEDHPTLLQDVDMCARKSQRALQQPKLVQMARRTATLTLCNALCTVLRLAGTS